MMKKLIYLLIAVTVFSGCNKAIDPDLTFGKLPEERMADRNAELKNKLLESPSGWKGFFRTSLRGGAYAFYMNFDASENIVMLSDWNNASAINEKTSSYRIKYVMNTSLIFDTYNYITIMQSPEPSINGGTGAQGLQSDIEFEYLRSSADSIILKGKRYGNYLYLLKATTAEKAAFEADQYLTSINNLKSYFTSGYPYVVVNSGGVEKQIALEINTSTKIVSGDYLTADQKVVSNNSGFAFAIDGAYFSNGLATDSTLRLRGLRWKNAAENLLIAYDSSGKEYAIQKAVAPLLPLHMLLGSKFRLQANFKTINPGTSTAGAAIIGHYVNNLDNRYTGYVFNNGSLTFTFDLANKRLTVTGWHNQNGNGGWNTVIVYDYTKDANGDYNFTHRSGPGYPQSGANGYVQNLMAEAGKETIDKFLKSNKVRFDYYISNGTPYGKMSSVSDPSIVMTLALIQ